MKKFLFSILIIALIIVLCPAALAGKEQTNVTEIEVGIPVEEHPELFLARSMPTHGEAKIAVFLIEFPDYKNENPIATQEYYDKIYFRGGVETCWGNEVSVASFYRDESYGKLNISGRVFDWYTAEHERSYYDNKKSELIMEAAEHYRAQGVDFSEFDGDGDGLIDAVTFHFAGEYSEERDSPWYDGVNIESSDPQGFGAIGDVSFNRIVQVGETSGRDLLDLIEVICHELMHSFGMPDLYSQIGHRGALLVHDLMSRNIQTINPYTKMLLGWLDTVEVVTGDVENIRLEPYGTNEGGKAVIVTNKFNGLFDEFFIVAYREYSIYNNTYYTAVIWHVDARLNEDGTAFLFENLSYQARPDQDIEHDVAVNSPYLFIEEISADHKLNFVQEFPNVRESAFLEDSVFGPDCNPSSDLHDGSYTGIRIDNFVQHDISSWEDKGDKEPYLTFDVSFVKDKNPPAVITAPEDMAFHQSTTIEFNESIYMGDDWESIKVTDLEGETIDVSVIKPHYPNNEIEITFKSDAYKKGYKVVLPKGCVCDSSGNEIEEITLTAISSNIFPLSSAKLPSAGYTRGGIYLFTDESGISVVSLLWDYSPKHGTNEMDRKIEIMRLDRDGNLVSQVVVDNPFEDVEIPRVMRTSAGDYLFLCKHSMSSGTYLLAPTLFFCLDANGELKWTNVSIDGTGIAIYDSEAKNNYFESDGDLVIKTQIINSEELPRFMRMDLDSGEMSYVETPYDADIRFCSLFDLGNGRVLSYGAGTKIINGVEHKKVQLLDAVTLEVICESYIPNTVSVGNVIEAHGNKDGTILLYCRGLDNMAMLRLDAILNVVDSIEWARNKVHEEKLYWLEDGFYIYELVGLVDGDNSDLHFRRYDQYLNFVWESDVSSGGTFYFMSSNGDIKALSSMWKPERECYIDDYGSEEKYLKTHTHTVVYVEAIDPTCTSDGCIPYWCCSDCGVIFSDEGRTVVLDANGFDIPRFEHAYEIVIKIEPTCVDSGIGYLTCTYCGGNVKGHEEIIPANRENHASGKWMLEREASCQVEGLEVMPCRLCGEIIDSRSIPTSDKYHIASDWERIKEPTTYEAGEEIRTCKVCGETVDKRSIDKLPTTDNPSGDKPADDKPADTPSPSTTGCGGTLGAGACAIAAIIALGGAIVFKKKEF